MNTKDIYRVDLNPTRGAEIKKIRPCIVVSNDDIGILPLKVVIPLIGHKILHENKSWLVKIAADTHTGLSKPSTADALQMRSVSHEQLVEKIGVIDDETYTKVITATKVVLNIK